jgi:hypothetical protein
MEVHYIEVVLYIENENFFSQLKYLILQMAL